MALTAADWQRIILLEVGAGLDGDDPVEEAILDKVTPNIDLFWNAWADKALVYPRLQYLYCKRQCLQIIEGQLRDLVQVNIGGLSTQQQQKLSNLLNMQKRVDEEIKDLELKAQAARPVVVIPLTQTNPRLPDVGQIDPNNPAYRGDALIRPRRNDPLGWQQGIV
jgi:hypothetical protein